MSPLFAASNPSDIPSTGSRIGRRQWLAAGASAAVAAAAAPARSAVPATPASLARELTAATTEGPYYLATAQRPRADITEGLAGVPLEVRFNVMDADGQALADMAVDIWHCDAAGLYSGFAGQGDDRTTSTEGKTFLRGRLTTGADGLAVFQTIYPGWYAGRTTHIHCKVWNGAQQVLTTQFFLPDALSEFLYVNLSSYRRARVRDVLNSTDGIALEAGDTVAGAVREARGGYIAALSLVVDPSRRSVAERPGRGGGPGSGRVRPEGSPPAGRPGRPRGPEALSGSKRLDALVPHAASRRP